MPPIQIDNIPFVTRVNINIEIRSNWQGDGLIKTTDCFPILLYLTKVKFLCNKRVSCQFETEGAVTTAPLLWEQTKTLREQYNSMMTARLSERNVLFLLNFFLLAVFFTSDVQFLARKVWSISHAEISFTAHRIKRTVKIWSGVVDNKGFF